MKYQQKRLSSLFIAIFLTICTYAPVSAVQLQNHKEIQTAVKKFIKLQRVSLKNLQVSITSLNQQLRLAQCSHSPEVNMAPGTKLIGHTSLSVSCASPQKWKIHIAAHIDGEVDALVARHPIPRGMAIQETDLKFVKMRYSQLNHGYYGTTNLLKNMVAKRNIKVGRVLTSNLVKAKKLVIRGQHITIIAKSGSLNLRAKGKALMDGQLGQTIKVSNLSSKKLIYARVVSTGIVEINF